MERSTRSKVKPRNKGNMMKHKCKHKWQMKDKKKMVDGNVFISVMASSLHQYQWPSICVNSDGLNEEVLAMASWAHSAHKHSVCWRGNSVNLELT